MKSYSALILALMANIAFAGEVGALDPDSSTVASGYDAAASEIGASNRWEADVKTVNIVPAEKASTLQVNSLNEHMGAINNQVNNSLSDLIEVKVNEALSF